jgi:hypothetical protein
MLGVTIPAAAVSLFETQGSLRNDLTQAETIVSLYNGIHITLSPEEWPLLENAMQVCAASTCVLLI